MTIRASGGHRQPLGWHGPCPREPATGLSILPLLGSAPLGALPGETGSPHPAPKEKPPRKLSGKRTGRERHSGKQAHRPAGGAPHRRGKPVGRYSAGQSFRFFGQRGLSAAIRPPVAISSLPERKRCRHKPMRSPTASRSGLRSSPAMSAF